MPDDNEDQWANLPEFVVLNPRQSGMFDDTELSGMVLSQFGGDDSDGKEIVISCYDFNNSGRRDLTSTEKQQSLSKVVDLRLSEGWHSPAFFLMRRIK